MLLQNKSLAVDGGKADEIIFSSINIVTQKAVKNNSNIIPFPSGVAKIAASPDYNMECLSIFDGEGFPTFEEWDKKVCPICQSKFKRYKYNKRAFYLKGILSKTLNVKVDTIKPIC